jgi:choline monooxygenase
MPLLPDIDPQIAKAKTLPARAYTCEEVYGAQLERVFAPSWQWVGDERSVKVPGQVWPTTVLEGTLDEPIVFTRDADDALHCVSNVCTHRGNIVVEAGGNERFLRCRYHGRRFGLDGRFQHMPEFEGVEGFPSACDDLARIPFAQWGPLLFCSLAPRAGFDDVMRFMTDRVGWLPLHEFRFEASRSRDYLVQANWALYVDNYLEGFHIPFIHAGLNEAIDYGTYTTELFDHGNLQLAYSKGGDHAFAAPPGTPDHGRSVSAYYFWVFPNLMFNFYPWGLSINVVKPLAVDRTRVSFICYMWDESKLGGGAGAALDRVEREDEAVVELVQRGIRSRFYDRGRYSPSRETGTHHFHRLLTAAVNDSILDSLAPNVQ